MSGAPRIRSINVADSDTRPLQGPGGNKFQKPVKPISKPLKDDKKSTEQIDGLEDKNGIISPNILAKSPSISSHSSRVPSTLRRHESLLHSNLSLSASCSSDASTDSTHSRASTGRITRTNKASGRKTKSDSKTRTSVPNVMQKANPEPSSDGLQPRRRCAWVTASTDPSYITFHDEEWGVPTHDDKKLFELLVFCGALAELTWPAILSKRHLFREVFADFDPIAVAKLNEKRIVAPGSPASQLLSELKLRAIIENARQVSKIIDEFGSFDKYIWSFVNYKPLVNSFRYPRQVPVKTPKADVISKDLVRRGFRSVGPTVVYSFMQVAGLTNDHLISCFRFHDCNTAEVKEETKMKAQGERDCSEIEPEICRSIDELSLSSE